MRKRIVAVLSMSFCISSCAVHRQPASGGNTPITVAQAASETISRPTAIQSSSQLHVTGMPPPFTTGTASGTVIDSTGAVVPGAIVTFRNTNTLAVSTTKTDGRGHYTFSGLVLGTYQVTVASSGFQDMRFEKVAVTAAQSVTRDATLAPSNATAVSASVPIASGVGVAGHIGHKRRESTRSRTSASDRTDQHLSDLLGNLVGPGLVNHKRNKDNRSPASVADQNNGSDSQNQHSPIGEDAEKAAEWFEKLNRGLMEYSVPSIMTLNRPTTVTVVIHGERASMAPELEPGTPSTSLKVSDWMSIQLTQPDNPEEFTIEPKEQPARFVPKNLATTWTWRVTPAHMGQGQKLTLKASVLIQVIRTGCKWSFLQRVGL